MASAKVVGNKEILKISTEINIEINADWAKRTYENTLTNWKSRLDKMSNKNLLEELTLNLQGLTDPRKRRELV